MEGRKEVLVVCMNLAGAGERSTSPKIDGSKATGFGANDSKVVKVSVYKYRYAMRDLYSHVFIL